MSECPEWHQMLTNQSCAAGKHPDWFIDSEHNHPCPWCEVERLRAVVAAVQALCDESGPRVMSDGIVSSFALDRRQVIAALAAAPPTEPAREEEQ